MASKLANMALQEENGWGEQRLKRQPSDARIAYFKAILNLKHKMFTVLIGKLPKMVALP